MHIRYDLKNKLDLSQFKTQSSFFLQKEDCVFSFYLKDFAISFNVEKLPFDQFKIDFSISEIETNQNGDEYHKTVSPLSDFRMKDIDLFNEMFDGKGFSCLKKSKEEVFEFAQFMINCVRKIKKLSNLA